MKARLVAEACQDAATVLPNDLESGALAEVVEHTVRASQILSVEFGDFIRSMAPGEALHLPRPVDS
jgi:hypothetical protein